MAPLLDPAGFALMGLVALPLAVFGLWILAGALERVRAARLAQTEEGERVWARSAYVLRIGPRAVSLRSRSAPLRVVSTLALASAGVIGIAWPLTYRALALSPRSIASRWSRLAQDLSRSPAYFLVSASLLSAGALGFVQTRRRVELQLESRGPLCFRVRGLFSSSQAWELGRSSIEGLELTPDSRPQIVLVSSQAPRSRPLLRCAVHKDLEADVRALEAGLLELARQD